MVRECKKCKHLKVSEFRGSNNGTKPMAIWSCESWECEYEPVEEEQTGENTDGRNNK